jgi:hypothetical protein
MIWLTWRQHRSEAAIVGGALALLVLLLILTGRAMAGTYQQMGVGACLIPTAPPSCGNAISAFQQQYALWGDLLGWFNLSPLLLAVLVGAPSLIAAELEHHTHHLVWTQSITRLRWLATKLVVVIGVSLAAWVVITALITWWRGPFDALYGRLSPSGFDVEGIVPYAYLAYALALAVAAGALLRRTVFATAATMAGFLAARLPVELWARPQYQPPLSATWDPYLLMPTVPQAPAAWRFEDVWMDGQGHAVDILQVFRTCASNATGASQTPRSAFTACTHAHGWLLIATWQPADRFWLFQGIESAIFFGLAVALLALTVWWVRRRLA